MAKRFRFTEEEKAEKIQSFLAMVEKNLKDEKNFNSSKNFTFSPGLEALKDAKVYVYFTSIAYMKMTKLVSKWTDECAWHGTVVRLDDNTFVIDDILVYPQTVTAANVDFDEGEYGGWLAGLSDDTHRRLRFQGHSHVNMAVSPSGTDRTSQQKIIDMCRDDDFYIWAILNKSGASWMQVINFATNTLYEDADVVWDIIYDKDKFMSDFVHDSASLIKKAVQSTTYNYGNYGYITEGSYSRGAQTTATALASAKGTHAASTVAKKDTKDKTCKNCVSSFTPTTGAKKGKMQCWRYNQETGADETCGSFSPDYRK